MTDQDDGRPATPLHQAIAPVVQACEPISYKISHITDLMQIPPEHWDECMRDLRGCMVSMHLLRAGACNPGAQPLAEPAVMCPVIIFTPDGKGEITPTVKGKPICQIKITRDETL